MAIANESSALETDMKTSTKTLLTAAAAVALGLSASAGAHDRYGPDRPRHWHGPHYDRVYVHRPYYPPRYVVRERVVVQRPVYVPPPPYYYAPAPVYRPGVVVSVDIPPIVIPLR
jgi:hypothetical protein